MLHKNEQENKPKYSVDKGLEDGKRFILTTCVIWNFKYVAPIISFETSKEVDLNEFQPRTGVMNVGPLV